MWVLSLGQDDPLEKQMAPTPLFLPENSHGQRSLVGYRQQGRRQAGQNLVAKQQPSYYP